MTLHLAETIPYSLSLAQAVVESVGHSYHVALNGRSYLVDLKSGEFRYRSVPLLRPQTDDSVLPGESSVNPEDAWRRSVTSWHLGAGQPNADRDPTGRDLSPSRFRESKGINVWTDDQISLMYATDEKRDSSNAVLKMVVAGSHLYFIDGTTLGYVTDPTAATWSATTVSGTAGTLIDLATDGVNVWCTSGANVYSTTAGGGSVSTMDTEDLDVLAYTKGRLMAAEDNEIFYWNGSDFISLFAHGNASATWVGFAEGRNAIYAALNSGGHGIIYRIPIKPDGSALDLPIVAGETLAGETITGIGGAYGFVFVGTSKGIRFCEADAQGNLTLGAPFGPTSCKTFCAWDRYVYFGWTAYDGTSTGLGRFTPLRFAETDARIPAYASDLMSTGSGAITSVVTFGDKPYYAVASDGFYGQDGTNLVTSGTIDSGDYGFGLADEKVSLSLDVAYADFVGTLTAYLAADGGSMTQIGSTTTAATVSDRFPTSEKRGEKLEVRLTLTQASATTGPTVTRWGLRAQPAPILAHMHYVPLIFKERERVEGGADVYLDVQTALEELVDLNQSRDVVTFQRGGVSHSVVIDDLEFRQDYLNPDTGLFEGNCLVALKEV